jgi:hypothetical protein
LLTKIKQFLQQGVQKETKEKEGQITISDAHNQYGYACYLHALYPQRIKIKQPN